jgi:hypothetical protein
LPSPSHDQRLAGGECLREERGDVARPTHVVEKTGHRRPADRVHERPRADEHQACPVPLLGTQRGVEGDRKQGGGAGRLQRRAQDHPVAGPEGVQETGNGQNQKGVLRQDHRHGSPGAARQTDASRRFPGAGEQIGRQGLPDAVSAGEITYETKRALPEFRAVGIRKSRLPAHRFPERGSERDQSIVEPLREACKRLRARGGCERSGNRRRVHEILQLPVRQESHALNRRAIQGRNGLRGLPAAGGHAPDPAAVRPLGPYVNQKRGRRFSVIPGPQQQRLFPDPPSPG